MLSGTSEKGSPSAGRVWYEDGRENYHHGSWGGKHYKFLGVLENVQQDERLALACAAKSIYAGYLLYGPGPCLIVTVYGQLTSMHSRCCGT